MGDITEVTGIILSSMPVGEYDRRVVILTKERGKISAFAKGARRPNSPLTGVTRSFIFGSFQMYEGRTSYTIKQANIKKYFENVLNDYDATMYACYFAQLADYYGRENLDASAMINLLYATLNAITSGRIPKKLVRSIYELKLIEINGELPDFFTEEGRQNNCPEISDTALYTIQYIASSAIDRLYTFVLKENVLDEVSSIADSVRLAVIDRKMSALDMLTD